MTIALHEQSVGATSEWYTPRYIFTALGCNFDVDVASPGQDVTPWIPAKVFITSNSLQRPWVGFVWMNPPFGPRNGTVPWLEKFFSHGNGIALVPDRTSAPWWQRYAPSADLVLFVSPKIRFIAANGLEGSSPAQGTTLLAAGQQGVAALCRAAANGLGVLMAPCFRMSSPLGRDGGHCDGYGVTPASGTLCPHCSRSLRVTAVPHIDESGFDIICESCHADIIRAERR